jgi:lipoprotein-anchoring transpeptidase ErfK/SrfK
MDKNGNVIESEAMKLGHEASHGYVRLAIPDAKWIYDNIRYETKVVIES